MQTTAHSDLTAVPAGSNALPRARDNELFRQFPNIPMMRKAARRRLPRFAFEYLDGGAGEDAGIVRNWRAFDAVEIFPRYGVSTALPPVDIELFGRRYAGPVGVAPMGSPSIGFPGADRLLATAAQAARLPYTLSAVGGMTIEEAAELAPDVFWFQLPRLSRDSHKLGLDLVGRAEAAGAHALILTMDTPTRTTRPREVQSGVTTPFRVDIRMMLGILSSPSWLLAMQKHGVPRFASFRQYAPNAGVAEMAEFVRKQATGAFSWDEVAMFREHWKRPLLVKGIMHPRDAERAIVIGCDGIVVSTHGGRQVDALPPPIDALPGIVRQVGNRATVLMDSGVRSGSDVVRAVALGAAAVLAGKAFMWSLGALGSQGPLHAMDLLLDETRAALGQIGALTLAEARAAEIRHPGEYRFAP
jgi:L-lactate dehydrogenase (cytochrome)